MPTLAMENIKDCITEFSRLQNHDDGKMLEEDVLRVCEQVIFNHAARTNSFVSIHNHTSMVSLAGELFRMENNGRSLRTDPHFRESCIAVINTFPEHEAAFFILGATKVAPCP